MKFTDNIEKQYAKYRLKNYSASNLTIVKGDGDLVWDDLGNQYLDFGTGIATASVGHCHPVLVQAIQKQAETLIHASNLYRMKPQGDLCEALVQLAGPGGLFFCNSGAEASETLIKLSRLYGIQRSVTGPPANKIIVLDNGFHGRTFGGMSATSQKNIQKGFYPLLPSFLVGKLNDIDSFASQVDKETVAILIEPIQGEGGIHVASLEFLQDLRQLCDEKGILLLIDEVQTGVGRTGDFFAHDAAGISADAISMAKGLGGGFPIGAVWVAEKYADLFQPGSHGCTFGGNPLACVSALTVLQIIEKENLLQRVKDLSQPWIGSLNALKEKYDSLVEIRGRGFLIGLDFQEEPSKIHAELQKRGLLTVRAGGNVVRLLPPLTVAESNLKKCVDLIDNVLSQFEPAVSTK